jgi:Protein of unknown function with HXXEE motif
MNKANGFLYSFIGLIIFQIFMSMEEILGHYTNWIMTFTWKLHNKLPLFPILQINEQVFMFLSLIIIIIFFIFLAFVFLEVRWSRMLAIIIGLVVIINGGFHILASLYFKQYIPGLISAIGLIIFGFLVIFIKPSFRREKTDEVI